MAFDLYLLKGDPLGFFEAKGFHTSLQAEPATPSPWNPEPGGTSRSNGKKGVSLSLSKFFGKLRQKGQVVLAESLRAQSTNEGDRARLKHKDPSKTLSSNCEPDGPRDRQGYRDSKELSLFLNSTGVSSSLH